MTTTPTPRSAGLMLAAALTLLPLAPGAQATVDSDLDAFVASLEGGWAGEENLTPFGKMPFALLFERLEDGSLHSRSSLNRETYIDLHFVKDETGRWILHEEAAMEGMQGQSDTLVPVASVGDTRRWTSEERPGYLDIDIGREADTLRMLVALRGQEHVRFELERLAADETAALRREMREAAQTSPAEGQSIYDVLEFPPAGASRSGGEGDGPVDQARRALAAAPEDARAHLALARTLGAAINENPANGPLYAGEMLASLQRAIELDPRLAEAYHWLVGYYLSAPPIAGGSVEKARETALRLAEFDAEGAAPLLAEIASRGGAAER